jgi:hypothetical protein
VPGRMIRCIDCPLRFKPTSPRRLWGGAEHSDFLSRAEADKSVFVDTTVQVPGKTCRRGRVGSIFLAFRHSMSNGADQKSKTGCGRRARGSDGIRAERTDGGRVLPACRAEYSELADENQSASGSGTDAPRGC